MTEEELLELWAAERPMFEAWGQYVVDQIVAGVRDKVSPMSVDLFIRIPPKPRLKEDFSLLEKAFYRKNYADPYAEITDKVGARFVVLINSDLGKIEESIKDIRIWTASKDRDFEEEQEKNPIQFDYAAIHYVVYCKDDLQVDDVLIRAGTPCEIQVKTLLQHAYSELTHDTIYKPRVDATPAMHRAAAKSMALIEATNDYFESVVRQVNEVIAPERGMTEALSPIYRRYIEVDPQVSRLEGLLLDALERPGPDDMVAAVQAMLERQEFIAAKIRERARTKLLFRQPSVLLAYFWAGKKGAELKTKWPLTDDELRPIFTDLGLSYDQY
tara:strand:+ start:526 stop:1509 length:984 start_codon:yes stop_codon:yes gene_type:complete